MRFNYGFIFLFLFSMELLAKEEKNRQPSSENAPQVQLCVGTEALGNEGQGMGASAFINYLGNKKCELGLAIAYEYGNDRGLKIGDISPFNINPAAVGKTECRVTEENGELYLTVMKATSSNIKNKRAPKILVDRCKVTSSGL